MAKIAVAPLVGAWIEIKKIVVLKEKRKSLPSWERGLKFFNSEVQQQAYLSLPSWERGLKSVTVQMQRTHHLSRSPRGSVD